MCLDGRRQQYLYLCAIGVFGLQQVEMCNIRITRNQAMPFGSLLYFYTTLVYILHCQHLCGILRCCQIYIYGSVGLEQDIHGTDLGVEEDGNERRKRGVSHGEVPHLHLVNHVHYLSVLSCGVLLTPVYDEGNALVLTEALHPTEELLMGTHQYPIIDVSRLELDNPASHFCR